MSNRIAGLLVLLLLVAGPVGAETLTFGEIVIRGTRRVEQNAVKAVIGVKPGVAVDTDAIDRDVRAIFALGRFADVTAEVEEQGGVKVLVYRLDERPLVREINFSGNKELKLDKLKPLVTLRTPDIYNPGAVDKSLAALRKAYAEEGYYAARISPKLETNADNEATLTFDIQEGEKVLIGEIRFEGNRVLGDRQLKKVMETKERWFLSWLTGRGTYKEDVLQNDLEILADQYYNLGYVQVKVKKPVTTIAPDGKTMEVFIEIEEGEQFRVGEVEFQGDLLKSREELAALTKLRSGDVFSRKQLREDVFALNDLYADQGYAYVNVSPLTHIEPERQIVNLVFDIEQGIQVHIDRINIRGNSKTRDKVIRREMKLVEGDLYSATNLKESRRKINNLGFFDEVNLTTEKGTTEAEMDLNVEVKERPTGTFSLGFGYSSVDKFIGQGSITQENFLGRALKLNLSGAFGSSSTSYQVGVTDPYFLDRNLTLGFDVYKTKRDWTDFAKQATGGDIKLGFPVSDNTRALFLYKYEDKEIYDVDPAASFVIRQQAGTSTLSSLTSTLRRDTTDYRLDPTTGAVSEVSLEYAGLGGSEQFARYDLDHRVFFPVFWGTVFSARGHLGYIQEVGGEEIPIDERFFLGGLNSLRGFEPRRVGPRLRRSVESVDPATGVPIAIVSDFDYFGGNKAAYFNAEYLFPIAKELGLKGVLFYDLGNAWSEDEDYLTDLRSSVGGGIRWFSPMGPLRLEWGYNLDPKEAEPQSDFQFSIGRFF
jgi:outer membrane protein insertion porin family